MQNVIASLLFISYKKLFEIPLDSQGQIFEQIFKQLCKMRVSSSVENWCMHVQNKQNTLGHDCLDLFLAHHPDPSQVFLSSFIA
jgi:hypothetical protein